MQNLQIPLDGGGCAAKVESGLLRNLIEALPANRSDDVLGDLQDLDDAAAYRMDDDSAIVLSVDFIAPVVTEPHAFGQIAAANAFSDLYAKGVCPRLALNILGFPADELDAECVAAILKGAAATSRAAGVMIVGGHSLTSSRVFYGLACVGFAAPEKIVFNRGAQAGDKLVLTKPLGTGVVISGVAEAAVGAVPPPDPLVERAVELMKRTNAGAARAMRLVKPSAATDVSGFGFIGHLCELLDASGVAATIQTAAIPLLHGVREYAASDYPFCSVRRNLFRYRSRTRTHGGIDPPTEELLYDAQTSGGVLMSVAPSELDTLLRALATSEESNAAVVGEVVRRTSAEGLVIELL